MDLTTVTNEQLLKSLDSIAASSNQLLARLIAYLVEVEKRGLHEQAAYCSMYDFCKRRLGLSNGATFRRLTASRLARSFPVIIERLERGEVHLEALVALRDHMTSANALELLDAVKHKTSQQVETLIAARFPRPDVPEMIRRLPGSVSSSAVASAPPSTPPTSSLVEASSILPLIATTTKHHVAPALIANLAHDSATVGPSPGVGSPATATSTLRTATRRAGRIEPRSEDRHALRLTISTELRGMIERAQELMRHRNRRGDLETVIGDALVLLVEKLEKQTRGKTARPQKQPRPCKPGHVRQATRRAVFERDGEQCTYVDAAGNRCPATTLLEIHHVRAKAKGGSDDADNLCVRCRAHNLMHAKEDFGREHVERKIDFRRRKSAARAPDAPVVEGRPCPPCPADCPRPAGATPVKRAIGDEQGAPA